MVFRLHYRVTFWFLLLCTALVCSRQYVGDHINCIREENKKLDHVLNTYCFIKTTFTVVKHTDRGNMTKNTIPFHGVGPHNPNDEVKMHAYYQWVPFFLFLQALFFYAPHFIWKMQERGRLKYMVEGFSKQWLVAKEKEIEINKDTKIPAAKDLRKKRNTVKAKFMSMQRMKASRDWAVWLITCELLNLLNLVWQFYFTDIFLAGEFKNLGYDWLHTDREEDLLEPVFPKMTKCSFRSFGPSGTIQISDAICVMALNIIHEKIFVVLWFWFVILAGITVLGILWRLITLILHSHSSSFNRFVWRQASLGPHPHPLDVDTITANFSFPDWLLLYYIGKNMAGDQFKKMVHLLAKDHVPRLRPKAYYASEAYTSSSESELEDKEPSHTNNSGSRDTTQLNDESKPANEDTIKKEKAKDTGTQPFHYDQVGDLLGSIDS
jgi:hypothetical protein